MRYAELTGDCYQAVAVIEGLDQHSPVRGREVPDGGWDQLPVQDLLQPGVRLGLLVILRRLHGNRS